MFPYGNDMRYPNMSGTPQTPPQALPPRGFPTNAPPPGVTAPQGRVLPPMPPREPMQFQGFPGINYMDDPAAGFDALYQWLMSAGAMPHQAFLKSAGKTGLYGNPLQMMAELLNNPQYGYLEHMAALNQAAAARPAYVPPYTPGTGTAYADPNSGYQTGDPFGGDGHNPYNGGGTVTGTAGGGTNPFLNAPAWTGVNPVQPIPQAAPPSARVQPNAVQTQPVQVGNPFYRPVYPGFQSAQPQGPRNFWNL